MAKKFLRRDSGRFLKLGRKKKQKWRNPTGRHNKMRDKRRGYPAVVSIGYKQDKKTRGKINGKNVIEISNVKDMQKVKHNQVAILKKVGNKNKLEIVKKAKEMNIDIYNVNIGKFLKKNKNRTFKK